MIITRTTPRENFDVSIVWLDCKHRSNKIGGGGAGRCGAGRLMLSVMFVLSYRIYRMYSDK